MPAGQLDRSDSSSSVPSMTDRHSDHALETEGDASSVVSSPTKNMGKQQSLRPRSSSIKGIQSTPGTVAPNGYVHSSHSSPSSKSLESVHSSPALSPPAIARYASQHAMIETPAYTVPHSFLADQETTTATATSWPLPLAPAPDEKQGGGSWLDALFSSSSGWSDPPERKPPTADGLLVPLRARDYVLGGRSTRRSALRALLRRVPLMNRLSPAVQELVLISMTVFSLLVIFRTFISSSDDHRPPSSRVHRAAALRAPALVTPITFQGPSLASKADWKDLMKNWAWADSREELGAVLHFITSSIESHVLPEIDPKEPVDPQLVLDFNPYTEAGKATIGQLVDEFWAGHGTLSGAQVMIIGRVKDPGFMTIRAVLERLAIKPEPVLVDLTGRSDYTNLVEVLERITGQSLPLLVVGGDPVGNFFEVRRLQASGEFHELLDSVDVEFRRPPPPALPKKVGALGWHGAGRPRPAAFVADGDGDDTLPPAPVIKKPIRPVVPAPPKQPAPPKEKPIVGLGIHVGFDDVDYDYE